MGEHKYHKHVRPSRTDSCDMSAFIPLTDGALGHNTAPNVFFGGPTRKCAPPWFAGRSLTITPQWVVECGLGLMLKTSASALNYGLQCLQ